MRLTSLLVLAVIVVGGVGIFGFNAFGLRDKIFKGAGEVVDVAKGYTAAKTPAEAMDNFAKAIKSRSYSTAAKYVTGNYAEQLTRGHDAASSLGSEIDGIRGYIKEKGLRTDKIAFFLAMLDPFPPTLSVKGAPTQDGDKAKGFFGYEKVVFDNPNTDFASHAKNMDPKIFLNNLHPFATPFFNWDFAVELAAEGQGDAKVWKLNINVPDFKAQQVTYLMDRHNTYVTGLSRFRKDLTNQRYASPRDCESEVLSVLTSAWAK